MKVAGWCRTEKYVRNGPKMMSKLLYLDVSGDELVGELRLIKVEQVGRDPELLPSVLGDRGLVGFRLLELEVAEHQHGGEHLEDAMDVRLVEPEVRERRVELLKREASKFKHQAASDSHGHRAGRVTRRVWGGIRAAKCVSKRPKTISKLRSYLEVLLVVDGRDVGAGLRFTAQQ